MNDSRLDQYNLGEVMRKASDTSRLRASVLACERAVEDSKLPREEGVVSGALDRLRANALPAPALAERLNAMAAAYDDAYLDLDNAADELADASKRADGQRFFRKARAAAALASALGGGTEDAIYEAAHAVDNQEDLLSAVAEALRAERQRST